jgi:hypothetical protein
MYTKLAGVVALAIFATGCSTRSYFKLPDDTRLTLAERPAQHPQGLVTVRPFSWSHAGGIRYTLVTPQGAIVQQGKLHGRFRVASLFWPPVAVAYWPLGFGQRCYDLTQATPEFCRREDLIQLKKDQRLRK